VPGRLPEFKTLPTERSGAKVMAHWREIVTETGEPGGVLGAMFSAKGAPPPSENVLRPYKRAFEVVAEDAGRKVRGQRMEGWTFEEAWERFQAESTERYGEAAKGVVEKLYRENEALPKSARAGIEHYLRTLATALERGVDIEATRDLWTRHLGRYGSRSLPAAQRKGAMRNALTRGEILMGLRDRPEWRAAQERRVVDREAALEAEPTIREDYEETIRPELQEPPPNPAKEIDWDNILFESGQLSGREREAVTYFDFSERYRNPEERAKEILAGEPGKRPEVISLDGAINAARAELADEMIAAGMATEIEISPNKRTVRLLPEYAEIAESLNRWRVSRGFAKSVPMSAYARDPGIQWEVTEGIEWMGSLAPSRATVKQIENLLRRLWRGREMAPAMVEHIVGMKERSFWPTVDSLARIAPRSAPKVWAESIERTNRFKRLISDMFESPETPREYRGGMLGDHYAREYADKKVGAYGRKNAAEWDKAFVEGLEWYETQHPRGVKESMLWDIADGKIAEADAGLDKSWTWMLNKLRENLGEFRRLKVEYEFDGIRSAAEEALSRGHSMISIPGPDPSPRLRRLLGRLDPETGEIHRLGREDWIALNTTAEAPRMILDAIEAKRGLEPGERALFELGEATYAVVGWGLKDYMPHRFVTEIWGGALPLGERSELLSRAFGAMRRDMPARHLRPRLQHKEGYTRDLRFVMEGYGRELLTKLASDRIWRIVEPELYGDWKEAGVPGIRTAGMETGRPKVGKFREDIAFLSKVQESPEGYGGEIALRSREGYIRGDFPERVYEELEMVPGSLRGARVMLDVAGTDIPTGTDSWRYNKKKNRPRLTLALGIPTPGEEGSRHRRVTMYGSEIPKLGLQVRRGGLISDARNAPLIKRVLLRVREAGGTSGEENVLDAWFKDTYKKAEEGSTVAQAAVSLHIAAMNTTRFLMQSALGGLGNAPVATLNLIDAAIRHAGLLNWRSNAHGWRVAGSFFGARSSALYAWETVVQGKEPSEAMADIAAKWPRSAFARWWNEHGKNYPGSWNSPTRENLTDYYGTSEPFGLGARAARKLLGSVRWRRMRARRRISRHTLLKGIERAGFLSHDWSEQIIRVHLVSGAIHEASTMADKPFRLPDGRHAVIVKDPKPTWGEGTEKNPHRVSVYDIAWMLNEFTHFHYSRAFHPSLVRLKGVWPIVGYLGTYNARRFGESALDYKRMAEFAQRLGPFQENPQPATSEEMFAMRRLIVNILGYSIIGAVLGHHLIDWGADESMGGRIEDIPGLHTLTEGTTVGGLRFFYGSLPSEASQPIKALVGLPLGVAQFLRGISAGIEPEAAAWAEWRKYQRSLNLATFDESMGVLEPMASVALLPFQRSVLKFVEYLTSSRDPKSNLLRLERLSGGPGERVETMTQGQAIARFLFPGEPGRATRRRRSYLESRGQAESMGAVQDYLSERFLAAETMEERREIAGQAARSGVNIRESVRRRARYPSETLATRTISPSDPPLVRVQAAVRLWPDLGPSERREALSRALGRSAAAQRRTAGILVSTEPGREALKALIALAREGF